jgi:hypothetical protein
MKVHYNFFPGAARKTCGSAIRQNFDNIVCKTSDYTSGADPDQVGSGPFWSDLDPDVWDRIQILALINDLLSYFITE